MRTGEEGWEGRKLKFSVCHLGVIIVIKLIIIRRIMFSCLVSQVLNLLSVPSRVSFAGRTCAWMMEGRYTFFPLSSLTGPSPVVPATTAPIRFNLSPHPSVTCDIIWRVRVTCLGRMSVACLWTGHCCMLNFPYELLFYSSLSLLIVKRMSSFLIQQGKSVCKLSLHASRRNRK